MRIKQNALKQIEIPFCENVFDNFIKNCLGNKNIYDWNGYGCYFHETTGFYPREHRMTDTATVCDKEYAYTQFYKLREFQEYKPFVEYKNNYEERKERLLMVYEETYDNWQSNSNNTVEMVFSNEYLIMSISRFL